MNRKSINDFAFAIDTEVTEAVNIAQAMIADAELAARAEVEAKHLTNCRSCQAGMVNWRIANPTATCPEAEAHHRDVWETCETCVAEYNAWADEAAAEAELASLGSAYAEELNTAPPHLRFEMAKGGAK